jgi:hypothetical protein
MTKDLSWLRTLPGHPLVVAEIKQRSPFTGWVNPLPWRDQLAICEQVGDIISVHTDEMWGGSWRHLVDVRMATSKPILAKGFHPSETHVKACLDILDSNDSVLTVGWDGGQYAARCWMECETVEQLIETASERVVWNRRCPRTGAKSEVRPAKARALRDGWLCQASHITAPQDVVPLMEAILIGQGLYT